MSLEYFILQIKPACEKFLRSPTSDNLSEFSNLIKNIESSKLDNFQSYILLPLILKLDSLDDRSQSKIKDQLLDCISYIISHTRLKDLNALKTILIIILKQVHDFNTGVTKPNLSEELKLSSLECMKVILNKSTSEVLEKFYTSDHSTIIGKIAVTCVDIINKEKYKKLRLKAIECLMQTFYVNDEADFNDVVLRNQVANVVFLFLPKIIQTLYKVAIGDDKQGETLICTSIKAIGRILWIIFEDNTEIKIQNNLEIDDFVKLLKQNTIKNDLINNDDEILGSKSKCDNIEEKYKKLQSIGRTEEWLGASSRKIKNLFYSMNILRTHTSFNIRYEYAIMYCNLIEKCLRNLKENFSTFLENIIALTQDENENIKEICLECIQKLQKNKNFGMNNRIFHENSEYLFENCITRLPRIIYRSNENEQLNEFLFLKGFIEILPDNDFKIILSLPGIMDKFCMCLITILDMKLDNELLIEECSLKDMMMDNDFNLNKLPWRRFKYCDSIKVFNIVKDIYQILGSSSNILLIYDHLMELLSKKLSITNEIILSLSLLLSGSNENDTSIEISKLIDSVMNELLEENHWNLEFEPTQRKELKTNTSSRWYSDKTPGLYESAIEIKIKDLSYDEDYDINDDFVTAYDAEFNVLHTCIILDSIGNFSLRLKDKFNAYMYRVLQRILTKAGSSNTMVFKASNYALNCIKKAMGYKTIQEFMLEFSDLISFHINQFLKKEEKCKSALDILSTIFQYNCFEGTSQIHDIIIKLLDEISKPDNFSYISSYLNVFHKFFIHLQMQLKNKTIDEDDFNSDVIKNITHNEYLYQSMCDCLNKSNENEEIEEKEKICDNENEPEISEDNKEKSSNDDNNEDDMTNPEENSSDNLPEHIKIIIKILKEVLKFLSSKEQIHKILSIECLKIGLKILKDYENELLPIVHLIWYPFIERFKENNLIVLNHCFDLLRVLCMYAKDFLLQRTLQDIIPVLNKFLKDSSRNSLTENLLTQTHEYKLQVNILEHYADIIISIDINERELNEISDIHLLYLSVKQSKRLQEYAIKYFLKISNYNKPLVHVKLFNYLQDCEFEKNIQKILKSM